MGGFYKSISALFDKLLSLFYATWDVDLVALKSPRSKFAAQNFVTAFSNSKPQTSAAKSIVVLHSNNSEMVECSALHRLD